MDETPQTFELQEPASLESLIPSVSYTPWIIGGASLLVLLLVMFAVLKSRKPSKELDPDALRRAAFLEAGTALTKVEAANPREAAVQSSLILRRYLSIAAGDPSLYETHEEFISRRDSLATLSTAAREACGQGFDRLAALKYAPQAPAGDPSTVVDAGRTLLNTLHHGFQAS
jgi:hypothetical protein